MELLRERAIERGERKRGVAQDSTSGASLTFVARRHATVV